MWQLAQKVLLSVCREGVPRSHGQNVSLSMHHYNSPHKHKSKKPQLLGTLRTVAGASGHVALPPEVVDRDAAPVDLCGAPQHLAVHVRASVVYLTLESKGHMMSTCEEKIIREVPHVTLIDFMVKQGSLFTL